MVSMLKVWTCSARYDVLALMSPLFMLMNMVLRLLFQRVWVCLPVYFHLGTGMHLYNLCLQGQTAINQAIHGSFAGIPKQQVGLLKVILNVERVLVLICGSFFFDYLRLFRRYALLVDLQFNFCSVTRRPERSRFVRTFMMTVVLVIRWIAHLLPFQTKSA